MNDDLLHSYPPSSSRSSTTSRAASFESTSQINILSALRTGPVASNPPGSVKTYDSSPPMTASGSSFQSETPLVKGQHAPNFRTYSSDRSQPYNLVDERRGSAATSSSVFNSEDAESRRSSIPGDWRGSFVSDVSGSLPTAVSNNGISRPSGSQKPSSLLSDNPPVPPKKSKTTSPPLQPLNFKAHPPAPGQTSPRSYNMSNSKSHQSAAASPVVSSPQFLPRSMIAINPFASLQRKFKGKDDPQLILELIQALQDYSAAFQPEDGSFSNRSARPLPSRLVVAQDRLALMIEEVESTVSEIVEAVPEFQHALNKGSYGPLALVQKGQFRSLSDRYEVFEPTSDDLRHGSRFWADRLTHDLSDMLRSGDSQAFSPTLSHSTTASSPRLGNSTGQPSPYANSPELAFSQNGSYHNSPLMHSHDSSAEMERTSSARSLELLNQGRQRWQAYKNSSPRPG